MAALSGNLPTLLDQIKALDPNGARARVVEMMAKRNPIVRDAVAVEGNLATGHRFVARNGLPTLGWRKLNAGVAPSKSTTVQIDETCGLLDGYSQVDVELARLNGGSGAFLASENDAFLQAFENEVSSALFYYSTKSDPEKIHGFSPRYDDGAAGINKNYILPCTSGASGNDQASMWFITWGEQTAHLIYPKGTAAGLDHKDMGEQLIADASGNLNTYLVNHWTWRLGLCLKDYRYHVRIANIDQSAESNTATTLLQAMVKAYNMIQDYNSGRTVIYCNRSVLNLLDNQLFNKSNNWLSYADWNGKPSLMFRGLPVQICDALLNTESPVSF